MALVYTPDLELGKMMPDFDLLGVDNKQWNRDKIMGVNGLVVMFICNHCPYVIYINEEIVNISTEYQAKGVAFIGISSNDAVNYPQDGPELMKTHAETTGYNFPYLYDESQTVAKAYDAACTPDFYAFDQAGALAYRGRLDESRPGNNAPLTGAELRAALDAILTGGTVSSTQYPSMGCNIKWR